MSKISENAAQARAVLRDAIQGGVYPQGSSLPSTRDLAAQFGINRNTATKIYHELSRDGLVELTTNRPPVVVGASPPPTVDTLRQRFGEVLRPVLLESRLVGMTSDDTRRMLNEVVDDFFATSRLSAIYIAECNDEEARLLAQELTLKLGSIVQPILLDDLPARSQHDVVVTPYFHLQEARERLDGQPDRLIGLIVTADSTDIARVVSMVTTGPLGVVAVTPQAAERLKRLLSFQIDLPMITASIDDHDQLQALRDEVECLACTVRAYSQVRKQLPDVPIALVQYHADEHSVGMLRRELQRIESQRQ